MESKRAVFERRPSVVVSTTGMSVRNRHQKPLHPLSHQHKEVEDLRGSSPSGKFDRQPCRNFLKGICSKSQCDSWHPPECQFYKSESGCKFGNKCSFAHRHVEGQPSKKPKPDKYAVEQRKDLNTAELEF